MNYEAQYKELSKLYHLKDAECERLKQDNKRLSGELKRLSGVKTKIERYERELADRIEAVKKVQAEQNRFTADLMNLRTSYVRRMESLLNRKH